MYQVMQKAPVKSTLVILLAGIALMALSYLAIQVFATTPPEIVQITAAMP